MKKTTEELIKVGDKFKTKGMGHVFHGEIIEIKKVENPDSEDGFGYFDTKKLIHRRKHQKARIWWFLQFCDKIN